MNTLSYKTKTVTPKDTVRKWYLVDAENQTLGRISSEIAKILQGKNKPSYTPNIDTGDHVVIINAEKVVLTGKKLTDKVYIRHTGYPGGQRFMTPKEAFAKKLNDKIAAEIYSFQKFWIAEEYHQNYEKRHPNNSYIKNVSIPRLNKFKAKFPELLKDKH